MFSLFLRADRLRTPGRTKASAPVQDSCPISVESLERRALFSVATGGWYPPADDCPPTPCDYKPCPPPGETTGKEGLTLGFWKNHLEAWGPTGFSPNQTLESVFNVPDSYGIDNVTLLQALRFNGGPTVTDAAKLLLKQAVAAVLNAAHPDVDYPLTSTQIINSVNAALASGNRNTILDLKDELDDFNNLGASI